MDTQSIVWVLGAGFSKSLGGPLLRDLFSYESASDTRVRFPPKDFPKLFGKTPTAIVDFYHYGADFRFGRATSISAPQKGEALWDHAEDFLDVLDSAAKYPTSPANARLRESLNRLLSLRSSTDRQLTDLSADGTLTPISASARRLLAAECAGFLVAQDMTTERWEPYLHWARSVLAPGDFLLSFNYDRVVEMLRDKMLEEGRNHISLLLPGKSPSPGTATVFKLHGSIDWLKRGSGIVADSDPHVALKCPDDEMVIATPGPSKAACASLLDPLWRRAESALQSAQAIVFLGYRFPPTDAQARSRLLDAIGKNQGGGQIVVRTVLGPDKESAERLERLVEYKLRSAVHAGTGRLTVVKEPLLVEDFLSVCSRDSIFEQSVT